jgi:hypothetical protein
MDPRGFQLNVIGSRSWGMRLATIVVLPERFVRVLWDCKRCDSHYSKMYSEDEGSRRETKATLTLTDRKPIDL